MTTIADADRRLAELDREIAELQARQLPMRLERRNRRRCTAVHEACHYLVAELHNLDPHSELQGDGEGVTRHDATSRKVRRLVGVGGALGEAIYTDADLSKINWQREISEQDWNIIGLCPDDELPGVIYNCRDLLRRNWPRVLELADDLLAWRKLPAPAGSTAVAAKGVAKADPSSANLFESIASRKSPPKKRAPSMMMLPPPGQADKELRSRLDMVDVMLQRLLVAGTAPQPARAPSRDPVLEDSLLRSLRLQEGMLAHLNTRTDLLEKILSAPRRVTHTRGADGRVESSELSFGGKESAR